MPVFIGNREDIVRTTAGYTFTFEEEGSEVYVPPIPSIVKLVKERGHVEKKEPKADAVVPRAQAKPKE